MFTVTVKYLDGTRRVIPFDTEEEAKRECDDAAWSVYSGLLRSVEMHGPVPLRFADLPKRRQLLAA